MSTGNNNTAVGFQSLDANTTGIQNTAVGSQSLTSNTTGNANIAIGTNCLNAHVSGDSNTAIGDGCISGNFSGSVILGRSATSTANNQFVLGSAVYNAGSVTAEVNVSANVWNVIINGVARKILLA